MKPHTLAELREIVFRVGAWLKGIDGGLEVASGVALMAMSPERAIGLVRGAILWLTRYELVQDPRDLVANALRHAAARLSVGSEHFIAVYLLAHGVIKIVLVVALLRRILWAYPASLIVFGGFVVYQVYRYALSASLGLAALTVIDLVVMWFIWLEYRALTEHRRPGFARPRS